MKPTVTEKINEILDVEESEETTEIVSYAPAEVETTGNPERDMDHDFNVARKTIHNLIDKGNELVDHANFFAKEKQDPRSVEAAAMAQKEARDNALALIGMHKTRKEIEKVSGQMAGDTNITQNNAVFVGSTGELLKQMKEMNAGGILKDALKTIDIEAAPLNISEKK